jgi:predicted DNA-binding protein (MmcQ/YjbR family)
MPRNFGLFRLKLLAMDNERIREICLALPNVTETLNWGHHLVYWVGDRDIGGKMFAMADRGRNWVQACCHVPLRRGTIS